MYTSTSRSTPRSLGHPPQPTISMLVLISNDMTMNTSQ